MAEARIETTQGFTDATGAAIEKFGTFPWWRGHSVSTWKLRPHVFRKEDVGDRYEQSIAQTFMLRARSRYPNCPDRTDAPNWLFLMQHYGLPTRLLDWTRSILFATYFAVRHEKYHDEDGAVWALVGSNLNQDQTDQHVFFGSGSAQASPLFNEALGVSVGEPSNYIIATNSDETDPRMMVQLSEFTLHGTPTPIEELPNKDDFLMQFIIPKAVKLKLKNSLQAFGITESALFPDLEHLAKELRDLRFRE